MPEALWTQEYLTQLHEAREGQVELDNASLVVLANYRAVCEQIKTLEAKQVELRTALIGAMGDAEVAVANGNELYSYRSSATKRLNSKALAQLHPDVAADPNIYTTSITRTFRVKGNTHE
jgi:predicted phage-related endonuclease